MKKLLILLLAVIPLAGSAQKFNFGSLYDKYSGNPDFTTVEINGELLKMFGGGSVNINGDKELSKMLDGIQFIRIVISKNNSQGFRDDAKKVAADNEYKVMTTINEGTQKISFYYKDKPDSKRNKSSSQSEFLMILLGESENLAINITGDIDIRKISQLSNFKISGMDNLDKIGNE